MAERYGERPLAPDDVREVYRRRAARYDFTSRLYGLLGFRLDRYRREAVDRLRLKAGDTVVELGCGTGANFPALRERIGAGGRLIGVDLADGMLERARARAVRHGWSNVELVLSEAGRYRFPEGGVDGVLSTYALTLFPDFDAVIERSARALRPGRRLVILDFKAPAGLPIWLLKAVLPLLRPFAVTLGLAERKPWLSIRRHMKLVSMDERYFGTSYIAVGVATRESPPRTAPPGPDPQALLASRGPDNLLSGRLPRFDGIPPASVLC